MLLKIKRVLSLLVALLLVSNLFVFTAFAVDPDEVEGTIRKGKSVKVTGLITAPDGTEDGQDVTQITASTYVTFSEAATYINKFNESLDKIANSATNTLSNEAIVTCLGQALMYADWDAHNYILTQSFDSKTKAEAALSTDTIVSSEEQTSTWKQYTIFGEEPFAGAPTMANSNIVERINIALEVMRQKSGFTGEQSSDLTKVNGSSLAEALSDSGDTEVFYERFESIFTDYLDTGVLLAIYNLGSTGEENTGETATAINLDTLAEDIDAQYQSAWAGADAGTFNTELQTLYGQVAQAIQPYFEIYQALLPTYKQLHGTTYQSDYVVEYKTGADTIWYAVKSGQHAYGTDQSTNPITSKMSSCSRALLEYALYIVRNTVQGSTAGTDPGTTSINLDSGILPVLATAKMEGGEIVSDGMFDLTTVGYYVLGASIVYDPFASIAGCDEYMSVIAKIFDNSSEKDKLLRALQTALNTKKPLYVTQGLRISGATSESIEALDVATYRTAYLADVLNPVNKRTVAFAVIKGQMTRSGVDASTWDYVKYGTGTSTSPTYAEVSSTEGEAGIDSSNMTGSVTTGSVAEENLDYRVPGNQELTATGVQMSNPVMYLSSVAGNYVSLSSSLASRIGATTNLIIHNAALHYKDNKYFQKPETEVLFLNGLGDIVLSDGTIVLPAAANPALFEYTNASVTSVDQMFEADTGVYYDGVQYGYYPYNAALLNHYPVSRTYDVKKVQVANSIDDQKYVFTHQNGNAEIALIKSTGVHSKVNVTDTSVMGSVVVAGSSFAVEDDEQSILNLMPYLEMEQTWGRKIGSIGALAGDDAWTTRYLQTFRGGKNLAGLSYFPLVETEDALMQDYLDRALPLVTSFVRYISHTDTSGTGDVTGRTFRVEAYIRDFLGQGLLGTQYSETIIKNNQLSYDQLVDDQYNRFVKFAASIASDVVDTFGRIDGVLSIRDGYSNGFFNTVMQFIQKFYMVIVVILLILVAVKFLRGHYNFIYVAFLAFTVFAAFEVYAFWLPTGIPGLYNVVVNDVVEDVVWNTIAVTAEKYETTYGNANRKDVIRDEVSPYTSTITLYKLTHGEMDDVTFRLGVTQEDVYSGKVIWIDSKAGIFLQGDQIKMSLDSLFANNSMRGLYQSQWNQVEYGASEPDPISASLADNPYVIKLENPYVSLESYYTPYCQIERALITNLNNFVNIFRVERNYFRYGPNIVKDAFVFNTFVGSGIFLAPNDDETLAVNIRQDQVYGSSDFVTEEDVLALVHEWMDPQEDWLNLRTIFSQPSDAMKSSLWGKMLVRSGYYNPDWTYTPTQAGELSDLIMYINEQTKQFILRNRDQIKYLSDENAIKIVSLYATTCFTHRVSEYGYWLYPNYVNSSDIALTDVLYGSMTTLKDRNAALDGNIINTVLYRSGLVSTLLIMVITVLSAIFIFIVTYLVPILYGLLGVILLYKLINSESSVGLVKGYAKATIGTILLYIVHSFALKLVKFGGYQWYGYLASALLIGVCLSLLVNIVMAIVSNPLELGNNVFVRRMQTMFDQLAGRITSLSHLNVGRARFGNQQRYASRAMYAMPFMRRTSVDDYVYGGYRRTNRFGRDRLSGYRRSSLFDDDYNVRDIERNRRFDLFSRKSNSDTTRGRVNGSRLGRRRDTTASRRGGSGTGVNRIDL